MILIQLLTQSKCKSLFFTNHSSRGQSLIEYALIILLIVIGVIGILGLFGGQVQTAYQSIVDAIGLGE